MCVVNITLLHRWLLTKIHWILVKPMNNFYFYEFVDLFLYGLCTYSFHVKFPFPRINELFLSAYSRKMKESKLLIKLDIDFYVHFNRQLIKPYFLFAWTQKREKSEIHISMFTYIALEFFCFFHQSLERKKVKASSKRNNNEKQKEI